MRMPVKSERQLDNQARARCPWHLRTAFTLVELLVAMVLTLILVYSIAEFYAYVGESVRDGRSIIEVGGHLRTAVERLKSDLDQITVSVIPWADDGGAPGYFEIYEGRQFNRGTLAAPRFVYPASDCDANGNYFIDTDTAIERAPNNNPNFNQDHDSNSQVDWLEPNTTTLQGDCDDMLAMTIRAGSTPFTGQMISTIERLIGGFQVSTGELNRFDDTAFPNRISNLPEGTTQITATHAEVAWWTSFTDLDQDREWDLGEPRFLHRRQLLIRPDKNVVHPADPNTIEIRPDDPATMAFDPVRVSGATEPYFVRIPVPTASQLAEPDNIYLYDLLQYCDVSIRPFAYDTAGRFLYFKANSLADLARPDNRFMHTWQTQLLTNVWGDQNFPNPRDINANYYGTPNHPRHPVQPQNSDLNNSAQYRWVLADGGRKGEDVTLSNVLAFDVRVYDPNVILFADSTTVGGAVNALVPSDPGYLDAVKSYLSGNRTDYYVRLGTGGYVDLGYGTNVGGLLLNSPHNMTLGNVITAFSRAGTYDEATDSFPGANLGFKPFATQVPPNLVYSGSFAATPNYGSIIGVTYDTWSASYERDGINQDAATEGSNLLTDEGTNGLDDLNPISGLYENGVDDAGERETAPPFAIPLRGIEVRIRIYEPGTRQMRQATVGADFLTE